MSLLRSIEFTTSLLAASNFWNWLAKQNESSSLPLW